MSQYNLEPFAFEGSLLTTNYHTTSFNDAFSKSTISLDVSIKNLPCWLKNFSQENSKPRHKSGTATYYIKQCIRYAKVNLGRLAAMYHS